MKRGFGAVLLGVVVAMATVSCRRTYVYMSDHGTFEFKRSALGDPPLRMTELVHFREGGTAWYLYVDDEPAMMFWYGDRVKVEEDSKDGQAQYHRPLFYWDMSTDKVKQTVIPGFRRPALDPRRNRVIYEVYSQGRYVLRAKTYEQLETAEFTTICSSDTTFLSFVIDPDASDKIFYINREDSRATFMEYDMVEGTHTERLSSDTHAFLKKTGYIAIDPDHHHLYWSQHLEGWKDDLIGRVNYITGGDEQRWIYNEPGGRRWASYPAQIAIDYRKGRLYWADINMNWVASAKTRGATLVDRDPQVLVQYPWDSGTLGPCNFHPTAVVLSRHKTWPFACAGDIDGSSAALQRDAAGIDHDYEIPQPPEGFLYPFQ